MIDSPNARREPWWLHIARLVSDAVERVVGYLAMALVTVMLLVVLTQVVFRGLRASIPWSEELSRMLLIWIGMLGAGIGAKQGAHVGVDIAVELLPRRFARVLSLVIKIVVIAFTIVFARHATDAAIAAQRVRATTLPWTMFGPRLALPVGAYLIAFHSAYLVLEDLAALSGRSEGRR